MQQVELVIQTGDIVVYFIALFYVLIVLTAGDLLRRRLNLKPDFTRKVIHLFAGAAIWTVPYYPHPWMATLVAFTFVVFLVIAGAERFSRYFEAMARPEDLEHGSIRGPLWYAVSITVLTGLFTFTGLEQIYFVPAAAIHIMMFGDGLSAPIGMKYGQRYRRVIFGSERSLHGSLALFVFGLLGTLIAFWFFGIFNYGTLVGSSGILWSQMITLALTGAASATLIELVSPKGSDNVTVPFLTTVVMLIVGAWLGLVVL